MNKQVKEILADITVLGKSANACITVLDRSFIDIQGRILKLKEDDNVKKTLLNLTTQTYELVVDIRTKL